MADPALRFTRQERTDLGNRISHNRIRRALCDHVSAFCPRLRAHLHDPVRLFQDLGIVIY